MHKVKEFIGELRDTSKTIKGFAGTRTSNVKVGTLSWTWDNDNGIPHKFVIPKPYDVPQGKVRLLNPQHWAKLQQKSSRKTGRKPSTLSQTTNKHVTLMWNQEQHKLMVPQSLVNNVASFHISSGFSNYYAFCSKAGIGDEDESDPIVCEGVLDYERNDPELPIAPKGDEYQWKEENSILDGKAKVPHPPLEGGNSANPIENNAATILHYHNKFGHISFRKLKQMAQQGIIQAGWPSVGRRYAQLVHIQK